MGACACVCVYVSVAAEQCASLASRSHDYSSTQKPREKIIMNSHKSEKLARTSSRVLSRGLGFASAFSYFIPDPKRSAAAAAPLPA